MIAMKGKLFYPHNAVKTKYGILKNINLMYKFYFVLIKLDNFNV